MALPTHGLEPEDLADPRWDEEFAHPDWRFLPIRVQNDTRCRSELWHHLGFAITCHPGQNLLGWSISQNLNTGEVIPLWFGRKAAGWLPIRLRPVASPPKRRHHYHREIARRVLLEWLISENYEAAQGGSKAHNVAYQIQKFGHKAQYLGRRFLPAEELNRRALALSELESETIRGECPWAPAVL